MIRAIAARAVPALAAALFIFFTATQAAQAEPHSGHHHDGRHGYYDRRHNHNHYYPSRGYVVSHLPYRPVVVHHAHRRYFYSGGVWYVPRGPRFVVVAPPIGVFVPVLPSFYTTVWIGGFPYYYANDTYYVWRARERAYEVVEPPDDRSASTEAAPASDDIFVYPKNGQSEERAASDRYECHRWAVGETGFDPTKAGGGVPAGQNRSKRSDYRRAMSACLEGRGYSVK